MKKHLGILPDLTKAYILERIRQEEIMEFYLQVPVNDNTLIGNSFTSPIRNDNNPTCNYYYTNDKLRLKDWSGQFQGDVFDVASAVTKINIKTSQGFKLLLHQIAKDFKIHKYTSDEERKKLDIVVKEHIKLNNLKIFKVVLRGWNEYDKRYWYDRYNINTELLKLGKVFAVQELHIENKLGYLTETYRYNRQDPAYAYYGGKVNGITIWKIYFPLRKNKQRFITNYAFIFKANTLPSRIGIITKSAKDVLTYKSLGLQAEAVPSETYVFTKEEFFNFKSKFDIVFTNFDYDKAGILLANKYKKIHKCPPLMFTRGRFKQPDYGVKDFSDFIDTYGKDKAILLIRTLLDAHQDLFDAITKQQYKLLKRII
jgi:hypothetical protein